MKTSSTPPEPPTEDALRAALTARITALEAERRQFVLEQHDRIQAEELALAPYIERVRILPILRQDVATREKQYLIAINELKRILEPPPALEDLLAAQDLPQRRTPRGRKSPAASAETATTPHARQGRRR